MRRACALLLPLLATCGGDDSNGVVADASVTTADATTSRDAIDGADAATPTCSPVTGAPDLTAEEIARNLSQPIVITVPPGETRFFIAEKTGRVRIIENGVPLATPFVDLHTRVSGGNEQGLLGMAFHPGYAQNGRFFVSFTDTNGDSRVWEYHRSSDPNVALGQEREILTLDQPASNHNGGQILFGPDGKLYVLFGDGGNQYDPSGNGQRLDTLFAKVLRIDVESQAAPYAIPSDNPFVGTSGARGEIWMRGLRNPWRMSFDSQTGDAWIGDVGQDKYEEVDFVPAGQKGLNFGWGVVEGNGHCPMPPYEGTCSVAGATLPVIEYVHASGCNAIVGGFVYRGCKMPDLRGTYFFSDNGCGLVRSFRPAAPNDIKTWADLTKANPGTFGEDPNGELLYCSLANGRCFRIVPKP